MNYEKFYWDQIRSRVNRIKVQFNEPELSSFLRLIVSLITGLEYGEVDEHIVDGADDLGADAIYFDIDDEEKRFKLYVIQTKYNKSKCEQGIFSQNIEENVLNKFRNIFDFFASSSNENVNEDIMRKKENYLFLLEEGYILDEIIFISANLGIGPAENVKAIFDRWLEQNLYRDQIKYLHFGLVDIFKKNPGSRNRGYFRRNSIIWKIF